MKRNILITGGAGFIGANFTNYWVRNHPKDNVLVLDALTYSGNKCSLKPLLESGTIQFIKGNINNSDLIKELLEKFSITHIVHFAAETHVDRSIDSPKEFITTNIMGTYTLLDSFHVHWENGGRQDDWRFLHVSTDEVFGSLGFDDKPFTEESCYKPSSPYSASKASSDHLVMSWGKTFNTPILISNCSNNYGPYQFPEKLIPLSLINILEGRSITIYGDGKNIRDWLYVEDHCIALDKILLLGKISNTYCIGASNEISNNDLIIIICNLVDQISQKNNIKLPIIPSKKLIKYVSDRPGHDLRYSINASKLENELNWKPKVDIINGLTNTIQWYLSNKKWWKDRYK